MPDASSDFPERFTRTIGLYGEVGFAAIRAASITVIGTGGVGAHAAVALARSGVGRLLLIDYDVLTLSSLNRFPAAVDERDAGRPKVELLRESLVRGCPHTDVETDRARFGPDTADNLLSPAPDVLIDAIDDLDAKILLLGECVRRDIPVISSMGAAARCDASAVRVAPIGDSTVCPLAGRVRKRLRREELPLDIPCVHSVERPVSTARVGAGDDLGLPSSIILPGIFGYALAAWACGHLAANADGNHLPPRA